MVFCVKNLVIKIGGSMKGDLQKVFSDAKQARPGTHTLYVRDFKELCRILAPRRMELLVHIINRKPVEISIGELAGELNRKQEAISRDADVLEKFSLVKKTRVGQRVHLKAAYSSLQIQLAG